jgi:predicted metal-dependent HD superfamily phosphohydrolase
MPDLFYIQIAWTDLAEKYCEDETIVNHLFAAIQEAYIGTQRYYHNLDHIESLLKLSEANSDAIQNKEVVDFSIFYHDIVYVAGRGDNEYQSALVAEKALKELGVAIDLIGQVSVFINATSNHSQLPNTDEDLKLFIDFDLSILATEREVYRNYILNIRKEYGHIPSEQFALGRKGFIQHLMRQPHIFHTELFREREEQARKNMQWEIEMGVGMFSAG